MRGRELYLKFVPILTFSQWIICHLPTQLSEILFELSRHLPGRLGFGFRYLLLKRLAIRVGHVVAIYPGVYFLNPQKLIIGDFVSIHQMCYLECIGGLTIGSQVSISHNVSLITHEHDYMQANMPIRDSSLILRPIFIEDDVWIGAGVRVLAGVTLGKGSVIGAGAVVTRSIPPYSIAVGVPAKVVKIRENDYE